MPVGEMLRRIDSRELTEWRAFFELRAADPGKGAPPAALDPEAQSALLKQALFRTRK